MQEPRSFAYSLSQVDEGWRWRVYDEDGMVVANGADANRERAQAAVNLTLWRGQSMDATRAVA